MTWEKLVEAIKASGKAYNMAMIEKAYNLANDAQTSGMALYSRRADEAFAKVQ